MPSPSVLWEETLSTTMGELSNRAAVRFGDRELMCFEGTRATFAETQVEIDRVARGLMALGIQKGDKVSFWMTNRPEWVHVMFALAKIGAIMVPINTRFRTADLDYVVRQSDSSALITIDQAGPIRFLDMVLELCPELERQSGGDLSIEAFPQLRTVISLGTQQASGVTSWDELLSRAEEVSAEQLREREAQVRPEDTQFMMYTSGTTGFPKGVMHCHNVIRNALITIQKMEATAEDCTIMFLPLFHAFGYFEGPLFSYVCGSRMVLTETFDAAEVLGLIASERGTIIHGFDTHWQDLLDCPAFDKADLSSLRTGILAAGLPSSEPIARAANEKICPTITGWGMTECMPAALISHEGDTLEHATCRSGAPSDGAEFKIIDPNTGEALPPGSQGEICLRSYALMQGYYEKPEETAKAIDSEGFLHTGDMGVCDEDGYIRFLGRFKDMLKVGGENVDPAEVEAYYLNHETVNKIQIVGVPDARLSEIAVAFVVLEPGQSLTAEDLVAFAKGRLASFKIPRHFFFLEDYPMTSSGKVKRFELRKIGRERLGIEGEDIEQPAAEETEEALPAG